MIMKPTGRPLRRTIYRKMEPSVHTLHLEVFDLKSLDHFLFLEKHVFFRFLRFFFLHIHCRKTGKIKWRQRTGRKKKNCTIHKYIHFELKIFHTKPWP